ncbi:hypothetical protein CfE428DRAFT_5799 [Chthoniobacter flavus Ellin428]|uniref:Uncharacterized protein n=1 Tax=Chthoniobacter flavus Ellin428 TaxID=497964 RepID=B4DA59_9BACT|nr:hypothetical protein CfE428DRAFT_5799 [Chthoniobacter flavus Ellin428]TCO87259.1 hypothetical protein EV701_12396 [Chthoniobacter flavus]
MKTFKRRGAETQRGKAFSEIQFLRNSIDWLIDVDRKIKRFENRIRYWNAQEKKWRPTQPNRAWRCELMADKIGSELFDLRLRKTQMEKHLRRFYSSSATSASPRLCVLKKEAR